MKCWGSNLSGRLGLGLNDTHVPMLGAAPAGGLFLLEFSPKPCIVFARVFLTLLLMCPESHHCSALKQ